MIADNQQGKHGSKWTEEDVRFLVDNYQENTYKEIADVLGRTTKAVEYQKSKMPELVKHAFNTVFIRHEMLQSEELAFLVGVFLGDGSVVYNRFVVESIDKDFIEIIVDSVSAVFDKKFNDNIYTRKRREKWSRTYWIAISCRRFCQWLIEQCGPNKDRIPSWIMSGTKEVKHACLSGLMSSDGWISQRKNQANGKIYHDFMIGFVAPVNTCGFHSDFKVILDQLGIVYSYSIDETGKYEPVIRFRIALKSFVLSGAYFSVQRKQDRLKIVQKYYGVPSTTRMAAPH